MWLRIQIAEEMQQLSSMLILDSNFKLKCEESTTGKFIGKRSSDLHSRCSVVHTMNTSTTTDLYPVFQLSVSLLQHLLLQKLDAP